MSGLSRFMKQNKKVKENQMHQVTESLVDEQGKSLEWEFKHITSEENDRLKDECTIEVQVKGKTNMFRPKFDSTKYVNKLICASVVMPDLYNAELQDSYGVKTPSDLLYALVDDPGEYQSLGVWVQQFQGFTKTLEDKVEDAKN